MRPALPTSGQRVPRTLLLLTLLAALALVLAACGGDDDTADTGDGDDTTGDLEVPNIAYTAPDPVSTINRTYGMVNFGPEFGLPITEENISVYQDHATASQVVLGGQQDVLSGSFGSLLQIRELGVEFQAFCPFINSDDFVMSAAPEITSLDEVLTEDVAVAVDSPGGAADLILTAMLRAQGYDNTGSDVPGAVILTSSGLRTTALASGDVQASFIHVVQHNQLVNELGTEFNIVANFYEDVDTFIKEAFQAPTEWLDENEESAAALCAAVIQGSEELAGDRELFLQAVEDFVDEPPDAEEAELFYDLISQFNFWPIEGRGFDEESLTFMVDLAVDTGLIEEGPEDPMDLVHWDIYERAIELAAEGGS